MGSDDKYTDPKLKKEVEEEVKAESKGGGPGSWSAWKAQQLSKRYKERGGEVSLSRQFNRPSQVLTSSQYTEDIKNGKGRTGKANKGSGKASNAKDQKSEQASNQKSKKQNDSSSRKASNTEGNEEQEHGDEEYGEGESDDTEGDEEGDQEDAGEDDDNNVDDEDDDSKASTGQKRGRGKQSNGTNKKQKDDNGTAKEKDAHTVGSKHQSAKEPAPKGSADRLPKKGQKVHWKSLPGYVEGEVVEIVHEEKEVEGKQVKASTDDPRIVLKSDSSGKICMHKPDAVYFE